MSTTLIATLGGIWALFLWGGSDWLIARNSKKTDSFQLNLSIQMPGILIGIVAMVITHAHMPSMHNALIIGLASFLYTVAFVMFVKGFAIGSPGIVAPAASIYPLVTIIFSAIFVGLSFTHAQILIMLIIMAGVVMLAFEKRDSKISLHKQHRALLLALGAGALWGIGNVFQNSIVGEVQWAVFILFIDIWMTLFAIIFLLGSDPPHFVKKLKSSFRDRAGLISGAVYTVGSIGFWSASTRAGSLIIPIVVSSASPLVTVGLARYYDGDKLALIKRVGAVVVVAGIILLNLN